MAKTGCFSGGRHTRRDFLADSGRAGLAALGLMNSSSAPCMGAMAQEASSKPISSTIKIDTDRVLGTVDPNLFGGFIEHKGRCIYGGVHDEGSPLSDADGDRRDVLSAIRDLKVSQLRWPGGNSVSNYHWLDGIGPKDQRPARFDLAWRQTESNRYGTDEFIQTCRKVDTEPYICLNMGTGRLDEAANWVEYCNKEGGTYFSDLRKKNGHSRPYNVKYWGLGNEMYGDWQIGHVNAKDYSKSALEISKALKLMDPTIMLVACGSGDLAWDRVVLDRLCDRVDFISAHHYTVCDDLRDYYEIMGSVSQFEAMIRTSIATCEQMSAKAGRKKPVAVAIDEWNIVPNRFEGAGDAQTLGYPYSHYTLRDALWVATGLNALLRNCKGVRLANHSQLVNDISPIYTSPTGMLRTTIYYPLHLYANRCLGTSLDILVQSPLLATNRFGEQPYLDVAGTLGQGKKRVTVSVVNRRKDGEVLGTVELVGVRFGSTGRAISISGTGPESCNTFENPMSVTARESTFNVAGNAFQYRFPKHSISWPGVELAA